MTTTESINGLTSDMVLGYFESLKSNYFIKLGALTCLEGDILDWHRQLSKAASEVARSFSDPLAEQLLKSIGADPISNLKEDAVTAVVVAAWSVFEQVIKDLINPDYATNSNKLNADYHDSRLGFSMAEREEIGLFYHIRNAVVHYNGAFHEYRKVDIVYQGTLFKSDGQIGTKIEMTPLLAMNIANDLEKYAMKAWSHCGRA